jgi:predicted secreted protein
MIFFEYYREKLLSIFCILGITFILACSSQTHLKSHIIYAQSEIEKLTEPNISLQGTNTKMSNITETNNICTNLNMKNNQENNITVKKGEEFVVTCKANRTAGYTLIPQFNTNILSLIGQDFQVPSSPKMLGSSGVYVFTFKALNLGSDQLKIFTKSAQNKGAIINQKDYSITVE